MLEMIYVVQKVDFRCQNFRGCGASHATPKSKYRLSDPVAHFQHADLREGTIPRICMYSSVSNSQVCPIHKIFRQEFKFN